MEQLTAVGAPDHKHGLNEQPFIKEFYYSCVVEFFVLVDSYFNF